jgi:hypothetical protein
VPGPTESQWWELLSSWLMLPPYCWKRREEGSSGEPKEDGAPSSDHVQYMYHPEASSPWGLLWPLSKSPGLQWGLGFTSGASCSWLGSTVRTNSCVSWQDLAGTGKRQAQNSRIIHSGVILSEPQHLFVCVHFKFWAKQWDGCPLVQRKDQTPSTWRVGVLWPSLAQGKHMLLSNGCFKHAHRCMCSLSLSLSLSQSPATPPPMQSRRPVTAPRVSQSSWDIQWVPSWRSVLDIAVILILGSTDSIFYTFPSWRTWWLARVRIGADLYNK